LPLELARRTMDGMRTHLTATILLALSLTTSACTDADPPAWQLACEALEPGDPRGNACKESCGAGELCPGADQPTCEAECNACAPDVAWCPAVGQ
jgi:hypothetical protein